MTQKMQAAQVEKFGQPLVFKELDMPTPGPGQILVKTEACGVCHTDLHARNGDWPLKPPLPFTPGHEGIGIVTVLGTGVTAVKVGDRVGVPWLYSACGHCEFCLAAQEPVCAEAQFGGYTRNGGFADYIIADPNYVAHIPAGLSAVDIDDAKLAHATRLGADAVVNATHDDAVAAVVEATGGGAHGVLITAPSLPAFEQGVRMTRKHGTCVLVGIPPSDFPTPLFDVMANCITIRGSFVGSRRDMAEALAFAAEGKVKADIELQPLSAINKVFERLAHGEVPSRVVLDFS
jgi:propanol-preferring alcohol dehydrogenase